MSQTSQVRYDVYVVPSSILCGQDVLSTHQFLRALVALIRVSPDEMSIAVARVLDEGDASWYKRAVCTRTVFKRFQAVVRGWLVRRHCASRTKADASDLSIELTESVHNIMTSDIDEENENHKDNSIVNEELEASKKAQSMSADLLDSYNDMLSRKSKAEDELKATEQKLKREKGKLARVLNLGSKHKTLPRDSSAFSLPPIRPPYSAPSNNDRSARNRRSIRHLSRVDEAFVEKITNLSLAERDAKKKAKRIEERENILKQRMIRSKQKESELKLQEQRISDLADKIRRQQLQLKEQKLQFEQSKFTAPPSPPDSSSRPCSLCSEKEMHLRDVKEKIKRRMRLLAQREAQVIGRAQELRKREMKLVQLQSEIANAQQSDSSTEDRETQPLRSVVHENQKQLKKSREEVNASNKPQQRSFKRKRCNASEVEGEKSETEKHYQQCGNAKNTIPISADAEVNSIRSSFGKNVVPTIAEEPHEQPDENDDSSVETFDHENHSISGSVATSKNTDDTSTPKENEPIVPTRETVRPMRVPTLKENLKEQNGTTIDIPFDKSKGKSPLPKSKPSPAIQRHVFAFEKKRQQEQKERSSICSRESASRQSSRGSKKHSSDDNSISSFDVQMMCAMNKLKELV